MTSTAADFIVSLNWNGLGRLVKRSTKRLVAVSSNEKKQCIIMADYKSHNSVKCQSLKFSRGTLIKSITLLGLSFPSTRTPFAEAAVSEDNFVRIEQLVEEATKSWDRGLDPTNLERFKALYQACDYFDQIIAIDPNTTEWYEARGQVEVDAKRFDAALADFNEAIRRNPNNFQAYSSRALAYEGLAEWEKAVSDYSLALQLGEKATGLGPEPYVMNSRGNAYMSIGRYKEALNDYEESAKSFQRARELDGAIYAASNAALVKIQLGNEGQGERELAAVARRAPASIDMRAALAAIYWAQGKEEKAEEEWSFACEKINAGQVFDGCAKYKDMDWLGRIRRWPPIMVQRMEDFLKLKAPKNLL